MIQGTDRSVKGRAGGYIQALRGPEARRSSAQVDPGLLVGGAGEAAVAHGGPERLARTVEAAGEVSGVIDVYRAETRIDDDVGLFAGVDVLEGPIETAVIVRPGLRPGQEIDLLWSRRAHLAGLMLRIHPRISVVEDVRHLVRVATHALTVEPFFEHPSSRYVPGGL